MLIVSHEFNRRVKIFFGGVMVFVGGPRFFFKFMKGNGSDIDYLRKLSLLSPIEGQKVGSPGRTFLQYHCVLTTQTGHVQRFIHNVDSSPLKTNYSYCLPQHVMMYSHFTVSFHLLTLICIEKNPT